MREDTTPLDFGQDPFTEEERDFFDDSLMPSVDPEVVRFGVNPPPQPGSTVAPSPLEEPVGPAAEADRLYDTGNPPEAATAQPVAAPTATEMPAEARTRDVEAGLVPAQTLVGKPVIDIARGKEVGTVRDVVFNPVAQRLTGFNVALPGLLAGSRMLPWSSVRGLGRDAVTIDDSAALEASRKEKPADTANAPAAPAYPVVGKRVLSEEGSFLGVVDELMVDRQTGRAVAYRLTGAQGPASGEGYRYLPLSGTLVVGQDVITAPAHVERQIQPDLRTIRSAWQSLQQAQQPEQPQGPRAEVTPAEWHGRAADPWKPDIVGRTATRDVVDDSGRTIVAAGQVITDVAADAAEAAGKLPDLERAASDTVRAGEEITE